MCEICSKSTMKTLKRQTLTSFWCLFWCVWTYFTYCSGVSTIYFEQVNATWVHATLQCLVEAFITVDRHCKIAWKTLEKHLFQEEEPQETKKKLFEPSEDFWDTAKYKRILQSLFRYKKSLGLKELSGIIHLVRTQNFPKN